MNKEPMHPLFKVSKFNYDNKLYEFSQKELFDFERAEMKEILEKDMGAKESIGSVLVAIEYLEKLKESDFNIGESALVKDIEKYRIKQRVIQFIIFFVLCAIFISSGLYTLYLYGIRFEF